MDLEILPLELRKLGLTEKEVRVYLAALELGYTSVQSIAQKAKISRPTAYEVVKSLKNKGLISESKDKSKKYFTAESPDKLLGLLKREKKEIEEKEREFIRIIAALREKYHLGDKRDVKTYQGKTGIETLFDDFLTTQSKEIYILIKHEKIWPNKVRQAAYQKITKRLGQVKILEKKLSSFPGTVIIYDKVIILTEKSSGLLIENKIIINLIKSLFLCI